MLAGCSPAGRVATDRPSATPLASSLAASPIPRDGAQQLSFHGSLEGRLLQANPQFARCGTDLSGAFDLSLRGPVGDSEAELLVAIARYKGSDTYSDERVYAALWSPPAAHPDHVWHRRIGVDDASFTVDAGERTGSVQMTLTSSAQAGLTQVVVSGRWSCARAAVITPQLPPELSPPGAAPGASAQVRPAGAPGG